MLTKKITYTDYNGIKHVNEEFYFYMNKAELAEMQMSASGEGGIETLIQKLIRTSNTKELTKLFKDLILGAYGEKSADGLRFVKSKELSEAFSQTEAYSELFMELIKSEENVTKFIEGIIPQDMVAELKAAEAERAKLALVEGEAKE